MTESLTVPKMTNWVWSLHFCKTMITNNIFQDMLRPPKNEWPQNDDSVSKNSSLLVKTRDQKFIGAFMEPGKGVDRQPKICLHHRLEGTVRIWNLEHGTFFGEFVCVFDKDFQKEIARRIFNIALQNWQSLKETSLPTISFQVRTVKFRGCISTFHGSSILNFHDPAWISCWTKGMRVEPPMSTTYSTLGIKV